MKYQHRLGIWMDHHSAHLLEFSMDEVTTKTIQSSFTKEEKAASLDKSEQLMHNKEKQQQEAFYKELGENISNYSAVLLYGPTDAKVELLHYLREDNAFEKIEISVKQADKMSSNQERAFVRDFFSRPDVHTL